MTFPMCVLGTEVLQERYALDLWVQWGSPDSLTVALADLELSCRSIWTWTYKRSTSCLLSAGRIKGVCPHSWYFSPFLRYDLVYPRLMVSSGGPYLQFLSADRCAHFSCADGLRASCMLRNTLHLHLPFLCSPGWPWSPNCLGLQE